MKGDKVKESKSQRVMDGAIIFFEIKKFSLSFTLSLFDFITLSLFPL